MRETIGRCSICKREDCNGEEYTYQFVFENPRKPEWDEIRTVCSSQVQIRKGILVYELIRGHGNIDYVPVRRKDDL
jgi:hypothetical protein